VGGSSQYAIPGDYIESIPLGLVTFDRYGVRVDTTVIVKIACPYTGALIGGCPVTQQQQIQAAYQPFTGGFMFWRGDTREIYVLYKDRSSAKYPDTWQEGETLNITETPPAGQMQPTRGFGKVWATQPGVRERLGWALAAETGYTTPFETHRGYLGRYPFDFPVFKLPDNRLVSMQDQGVGLIIP
jgi:hypothetical protein